MVLAGVGSGTDSNGNTGGISAGNNNVGEYNVTLNESQMPRHTHSVNTGGMGGGVVGPAEGGNHSEGGAAGSRRGGTAQLTGGNQPHTNIPPYMGMYIWKRTN